MHEVNAPVRTRTKVVWHDSNDKYRIVQNHLQTKNSLFQNCKTLEFLTHITQEEMDIQRFQMLLKKKPLILTYLERIEFLIWHWFLDLFVWMCVVIVQCNFILWSPIATTKVRLFYTCWPLLVRFYFCYFLIWPSLPYSRRTPCKGAGYSFPKPWVAMFRALKKPTFTFCCRTHALNKALKFEIMGVAWYGNRYSCAKFMG